MKLVNTASELKLQSPEKESVSDSLALFLVHRAQDTTNKSYNVRVRLVDVIRNSGMKVT